MSSSAFTPSTTTVTNNVPVNVPVVTAWEAYTPTYASGAITGTTLSGFWRRTGDTLETKIRIQGSAASSLSASTTSINYLPTGLTVDSTKLSSRPSDRGWTSTGMCFGSFDNSVYNPCMLEIENPATTARVLVLKTSNVSPFAATNFTALSSASFASTALNAADRFMEFHLSVPISQWAGSGTTTLATRAVEEYASNSSTSTSGNGTAFAYGPSGSPIRSYTSGANVVHSYTVRFQSQILSTDSLILEVSQDRVVWVKIPHYAQSGGQTINEFGHTTTSYYGMGIRHDIGSTTDISVVFGGSGTNSNLDAWSAFTNYFWRVRKVSGGAAVGYPVSARNIVGDTSGSVVPTGMLGEKIDWNFGTSTTLISSSGMQNVGGASQGITLNRGTYLLTCTGTGTPGATNIRIQTQAIISSGSGTLTPIGGFSDSVLSMDSSGNTMQMHFSGYAVITQDSTVIKLQANPVGANLNGSIINRGAAIRIA